MSGEKMPSEPFENDDIDSLDLPAVEQLAADRNTKINEAGAYVTALYWISENSCYDSRSYVERNMVSGKSGCNASNIERTRATKAVAIKNTFRDERTAPRCPWRRRTPCESGKRPSSTRARSRRTTHASAPMR